MIQAHMFLSTSKLLGVSRSDRKERECDPRISPDVLHNGERKSDFKVSRRSPYFYLKQVTALKKLFKYFDPGHPSPPHTKGSAMRQLP